MSAFDIEHSARRFEQREGRGVVTKTKGRKIRADRGLLRLRPRLIDVVRGLIAGQERPRTRDLLAQLEQICEAKQLKKPCRATVYKLLRVLDGHRYAIRDLPDAARAALYNLDPTDSVPGAQLAFYCFNYGDLAAMSFAAGLPWLDLYQANRMRGWRPRSHGLLRAVCEVRGI